MLCQFKCPRLPRKMAMLAAAPEDFPINETLTPGTVVHLTARADFPDAPAIVIPITVG